MGNASAAAGKQTKAATPMTDEGAHKLAQIVGGTLEANASGGAVAVVIGAELVTIVSHGEAPEPGARTSIANTFTGLAVRTGERLHCADAASDPRVNTALCKQLDIGSMVVVPLNPNGATLGVLVAFAPLAGAFSPENISQLEYLADCARQLLWPSQAPALELSVASGCEALPSALEAIAAPAQGASDFGQILATIANPDGDQTSIHVSEQEIVSALAQLRPDAVRHRGGGGLAAENSRPAAAQEPPRTEDLCGEAAPRPSEAVRDIAAPVPAPAFMEYAPKQASLPALPAVVIALVAVAITVGAFVLYRSQQPPALPKTVSAPPPPAVLTGGVSATPADLAARRDASRNPASASGNSQRRSSEPVQPVLQLLQPTKQSVAGAGESVEPPSGLELVSASGTAMPRLPPPVGAVPALQSSSVVIPAKRLSAVPPQYPKAALTWNTEGTVVLAVRISAQGEVLEAKPVSGPVLLRPAAVAAVMNWRYQPASLNGKAVESSTQVELKFRLR